MNVDLVQERAKASFSIERMTYLLDGGKERTIRRRQIETIIERDPTGIFNNTNNAYMHRTERHTRALAKHVRMIELCRQLGIGNEPEVNGEIVHSPDFPFIITAIADDLPTSLHWIMFIPNIISLCDNEQQKVWLPLCRDWKMIGCYAQTELGHGSNVRGLETTATFVSEINGGLPNGGSFVIHSPTITSTKFWPGTLGRTANHAMVMARLIDGTGIDRGIHNFLVPLRNYDTHTLLPGVTTGDIGPKIGYNNMDNGYAMFDQVHIPRRNMAMRFASVNEQGIYHTKTKQNDAASKIAYITMMQVRAHICNEAGKNLAMACTIVIRYSAVRRQGYDDGNDESNNKNNNKKKATAALPHNTTNNPMTPHRHELQILDYKQQQHRIFPLLAASYCFYFTGKIILQRLHDMEYKLIQNTNNTTAVTKVEVTDIHASSSALKSYTTTITADGIEDCRKACGGHGFLQCSGLPELLTTYLQNPTVEGDNHMLPQQVIKVLLKLVEAVQNKDDLHEYHPCDSYHLVPSLKSILLFPQTTHKHQCQAHNVSEMRDIALLLPAFQYRAARILVGIAQRMNHLVINDHLLPSQAWNHTQVEMARASRAYAQFLLLHNFVTGIHDVVTNKTHIRQTEGRVLQDLACLLALYWMERDMGDFLEVGVISIPQAQWIRVGVIHMLDIIRPNAVALVDARDFSDFRLKSALGRFDGDVYPAIMASARMDPLNQREPGPGYNEHLKRLIVDGVGRHTRNTTSRL
jgi:acyl-CoA oxidase